MAYIEYLDKPYFDDFKRVTVIKCPYCNTKYLPEEIYVRDQLIGHTQYIGKDDDGKIRHAVYDVQPILHEKYICDECNKEFKVRMRMLFYVDKID